MTLRSAPLPLSKLLGDLCKMSRPSVKQGVILQTESNTEGNDWVKGDVYRLQQILTNILTNSIKYTSHGSITLAASWRDDKVILECVAGTLGLEFHWKNRWTSLKDLSCEEEPRAVGWDWQYPSSW